MCHLLEYKLLGCGFHLEYRPFNEVLRISHLASRQQVEVKGIRRACSRSLIPHASRSRREDWLKIRTVPCVFGFPACGWLDHRSGCQQSGKGIEAVVPCFSISCHANIVTVHRCSVEPTTYCWYYLVFRDHAHALKLTVRYSEEDLLDRSWLIFQGHLFAMYLLYFCLLRYRKLEAASCIICKMLVRSRAEPSPQKAKKNRSADVTAIICRSPITMNPPESVMHIHYTLLVVKKYAHSPLSTPSISIPTSLAIVSKKPP